MKNILILSVGRRVELISLFRKAAQKYNSKVIAVDMSKTAPALYFADTYEIIPPINSPNYIEEIIKITNKYNIKLIVPTIDTELLPLLKNQTIIEKRTSAKVLLSNNLFVEMCRDKVFFQKEMKRKGFLMPEFLENVNEDTKFPIFIKPKSGSSSVNAYKIDNYDTYLSLKRFVPEPIIQKYVAGEEYTVDAFLDFNSQIISIVPRIRIETRGGEILKGKIVKDREIIEEVKRVLETFSPIGHITIQLIKNKKGLFFIEINPRYGGGAPMSINSGANTPDFLMRILNGEQLKYFEDYCDNDIHLRFDNSITIRDGIRIQ